MFSARRWWSQEVAYWGKRQALQWLVIGGLYALSTTLMLLQTVWLLFGVWP